MNSTIRISVLVVSVLLSSVVAWITPWNNILWQNSPLGGGHFPLIAFFFLIFFTILWNPLVRHISLRLCLSGSEILLIWIMSGISATLSYTGFARTFIVNMVIPGWMKMTGVEGIQQIMSTVKPYLFPTDSSIIRTTLYGLETGYTSSVFDIIKTIPWDKWIVPLGVWLSLIGFVFLTVLGITGLFSHQWIENERMNFPLLRVPVLFTEHATKGTLWGFLKSPYFIVGFFIPVFLHTLNGLHNFFPGVPQIPTLILAQPFVPKEGLLKGFYKAKIYIYPAFIGFAYLTTRQVSLSLWLFFVLGALMPGFLSIFGLKIPEAALGTTFGPVISKVEEMQAVGAYGVFAIFLIWLAREHLLITFKSFFKKRSYDYEYSGMLHPVTSLRIALVGILGSVTWTVFMGISFHVAAAFLVVCFMIQLVSARLICQGGLPYYTLTAAPSDGFLAFLPTNIFSTSAIYIGAVVQKMAFVDFRESLMPSLFHASALSESAKEKRRFVTGILLALLCTVLISIISMMVLSYKYGIFSLPDTWAVDTVTRVHESAIRLLQHPEEPKKWSMIFTGIGAFVTSLLIFGYYQFVWWPLHPIGYLLAYSSAMRILWFSFFLGWLSNALIVHYGGINAYRTIRWFFIGLIVGDTIMAVAWLIVGFYVPMTYHVFPL